MVYTAGGRSSDSGLPLSPPSRSGDQWHFGGGHLPLQRRDRPGFAPGSLTARLSRRAYHRGMDKKEVGDRQLDALLERLDNLTAELKGLNRRLDAGENLAPVVYELRALNESLTALAYAALGQAGPQVRRRRAG